MHPLLAAALLEAEPLIVARGWTAPSTATRHDAERLLARVALLPHQPHRPPAVQVEADGTIALEWEAGERGWLKLVVDGQGRVTHSAVIDGDEFEQTEPLGDDGLPAWAGELLKRLLHGEH